ncbi:organic hydroperoxide resistance protein [Calidifontibacter indicus]|jgi:Ohr subfamily peroxiredoxin|uniref:Ohr subfamily peroxiredoxin n=1 Tax=Calidifontibacter indicus TaxID=419650 RepID=A0A3D9UJZ1_9MICO|nr:organic hydroperoxide resistance protein [Calidifontibacter indicus]REF29636.1 Ohr subfamily peroxiredoxin [Calidifontibacter indicus]
METLYTAEALATGDGRNGHTKTTDGYIDLDLKVPEGMGGPGGAANPEDLFAAGYAACFHGALKKVAAGTGADLSNSAVGAKVSIGKVDGGGFGLAVELEVVIPGVELAQAQELADKAHQVCPYSNATRGNIPVTVTAVED